MTTIESNKKDDRSHLLVEKDQNKQTTVTLPPKKVMASKLAAQAAAAAAAAQAQAQAAAQQTAHSTTITSSTVTTTTKSTTINGHQQQQQTSSSTSTSHSVSTSTATAQQQQQKRRLSSSASASAENREKKKAPAPPAQQQKPGKSITHSDRIVQAEISQYRPYFTEPDSDISTPPTHKEKNLTVVLEYPGPVEPENFLLLKPVLKNTTTVGGEEEEDKDEYNPITDLMRTCEFIYDNYLTPEEQRLLGNQSHGIMRNLTKYRNRRSAAGFVQAVKEFNKVMRKLKQEGIMTKNAKEMVIHPNYDLTCHILYQVYSRTVARQSDALNNYQAFSNNVYGEINPILVKDFITKTGVNSKSVFMDLGCGIGNVVLQVAAQTGCEAYGIEIMETPCKFAKRQLKEYAARMKAWRLPTGKIHFRHGDFLDVAANDLYSTLKRSDVLLVNNYAFDAATNQALAQLFLDLKEGTKIISLKSFVPKHHKINQRTLNMPESILKVQEFEYYSEAVSWTNNGGQYYIATVDRSRLAPYFEELMRSSSSTRSSRS